MNKLLSRIAIAIASFAIVLGGVSIISKQSSPVHADTGDVVATFDGDACIGTTHKEWVNFHSRGWKISFGGDDKCGFARGEWKTIEEQGYSKYINGTDISTDAYGWIATHIEPISYVGGFDFQASYPPNSNLYLTYSLDDITYSLVPLTEGEQGTQLSSNNSTLSYDFNSIRSAYYAIVAISTITTPESNDLFQFRNVICHFYEKIDSTAERIDISGSNTTYAEEEIELTATTYNYSPSEYIWTSSDTSVATISGNGNRVMIHGVSKGTASITVHTTENDKLVYSDPFVITVKQFVFCDFDTFSIELGVRETRAIQVEYQDNDGNVVLEATSANTNAATVITYDDYCVYVTAGNVGGISTTVTITVKDNNGNEGCHIATRTVQVTVGARRVLGERLISSPSDEREYIYIATIDGNHFVNVNPETNWLNVTDDIKEATVFIYYPDDSIGMSDPYGDRSYISYQSSRMVLSIYGCSFYVDMSNDRYPGMLIYDYSGSNYLMYYKSNTCVRIARLGDYDSYDSNGTISPSNVFCAYYAVDPGPNITPNETSVELTENESTDITATVESVNSATYEILSGSQCIEEVIVSDIDDLNQFNIHIEASSNATGTAVIRVKDASNDSIYTDITVVVKSAAKLRVNNISTQAKLSYSYVVQDKMSYDISDVAIRFGGLIEKDIWDDLDTNFGIEAFGVMLSDSNLIEQRVDEKIASEGSFEDTIEDDKRYGVVKDNDIKVFYDYLSSGIEPAEENSYYFWNLYKMINATERGLTREYTAVAFILTSDGDVVFFDETTKSAALLAKEAVDTVDNINETTDGSMGYIASFYAEN